MYLLWCRHQFVTDTLKIHQRRHLYLHGCGQQEGSLNVSENKKHLGHNSEGDESQGCKKFAEFAKRDAKTVHGGPSTKL